MIIDAPFLKRYGSGVSDPKQPEAMTPASMRALADRLEREAQAQLARAKQLRGAADTIEALRKMQPLTTDNGYVTVAPMPSTETATKHPGPVANEGAASRVAAELGYASLSDLADALKESYPTVRAWNLKGRGIPDRVQPAIDRLRRSRKSANR